MEIRPILSALSHHKTGTLLVALQIAVSLAVIVNALFIINERVEKINRPTGMDTDNIIVAEVRGVGDNYDAHGSIERDLAALRQLPDVLYASTISNVPLSGSGSSSPLRTVPDDALPGVFSARFDLGVDGLDALGVTLTRGRHFYPEEINVYEPGKADRVNPAVVIVTEALARALYPDSDPLGKPVYWSSREQSTIVGIIGHMQGAWVSWSGLERNVIEPFVRTGRSTRYLIRAAPGARDALVARVEATLAELDRTRVIRGVQTHTQIIARSYEVDATMSWILVSVIAMLIGLTALVTAGLASFFVSQRIRQIGTRRALGATRWDIVRYFMTENWLITTLGIVLGSVLTLAVSYVLETRFSLPRLPMGYLVACAAGVWAVSALASWLPSMRAGRVSPAVATRTV